MSVTQNQFWLTIALSPILLFPNRFPLWLRLTAIGLMSLPWLFRAFEPGPRHHAHFDLLLLIFLSWHLPGFYATVEPLRSLEVYSQNLVGVGIAAGLLSKERTHAELQRLLFLAVLATAAIAALTPFVTEWSWPSKLLPVIPSFLTTGRWKFAEDVNPNVLGGLMVLMFPAALALSVTSFREFSTQPRTARVASLLALGAIGGMLLLSQARGGYLGIAIGLLLMAYMAGGKWRWLVAAGLWAALAGLLWFGVDNLKALLGGSALVNSWDVRAEIWSRASYMIQDFSFTGIGQGMYGKVANVLYPFFLISPDTEVGHCHNYLLQVAVDLGTPGLVVFCALLGYALRRSSRETAGLTAAVAALLIHGLLDAPLWSSKLAPAPWLIFGLLATSERKSHLKSWELPTWWLLISLLAISFLGDHFGVGLMLAIAGGLLIGLLA